MGERRRVGLLLDRDGVVVEEVECLGRAADVRLVPGAVALIRDARAAGAAVGVVTNQSGIARGLYGWGGAMRSRPRSDGSSRRKGLPSTALPPARITLSAPGTGRRSTPIGESPDRGCCTTWARRWNWSWRDHG